MSSIYLEESICCFICPHLSCKTAVWVMPATAVAMASMKVVVPMLEWKGSMAALSLEEAGLQQRRRRKLITPSAN